MLLVSFVVVVCCCPVVCFYHEGHEEHEGSQSTRRFDLSFSCSELTLHDVSILGFRLRALCVLRGSNVLSSGCGFVLLPRRTRRARRKAEGRAIEAVFRLLGVDVEGRNDLQI